MRLPLIVRVTDGSLTSPRGRLVVVDRSVILQRIERFVPDDVDIVLPDVFFHEAAEAEPECEGPRFNAWAAAHADRIWIARFWRELSSEETDASSVAPIGRIIHMQLTERFREVIRDGRLDWKNCIPEPDTDARRASFVDTCKAFSDWVTTKHPDWKAQFHQNPARIEWVHRLDHVAELVKVFDPRFADARWDHLLSEFPDRLAVCRMARLIVWYALCYSVGKTKGFGNNWEDAEYAFTASYVGQLVTADKGMRDATQACFPSCKVMTEPLGRI